MTLWTTITSLVLSRWPGGVTNYLFDGPDSGFGKGRVNSLQARNRFRAAINAAHSASLPTVMRIQKL